MPPLRSASKNYREVIYSRKCYCHSVRTTRALRMQPQRQAFSQLECRQRGAGKREGGRGGKEGKKKKYKKIPPPKKPPKRYHSAGSRTRLFPRGENGLLELGSPHRYAPAYLARQGSPSPGPGRCPLASRGGGARRRSRPAAQPRPTRRGMPGPGSGRS